MNTGSVRDEFKRLVCEQVDLKPEGEGRFRVLTPFRFEDGDHFGIVLKHEGDRWILTDEANTLMHLSYWMDEEDLEEGNRREIIEGSLSVFSVQNRDGELIIPISGSRFGDALFSFVQALTKVTDVSFLSRERVKSTFMADFRAFLQSHVPPERLTFDWTDPKLDPKGHYPVDCRINGMKTSLFVYALLGESKARDATINLLTFERWGLDVRSLGIFEEQEAINNHVLARFTDVCEKTFSSLVGENSKRIQAYLDRFLKQDRLVKEG